MHEISDRDWVAAWALATHYLKDVKDPAPRQIAAAFAKGLGMHIATTGMLRAAEEAGMPLAAELSEGVGIALFAGQSPEYRWKFDMITKDPPAGVRDRPRRR